MTREIHEPPFDFREDMVHLHHGTAFLNGLTMKTNLQEKDQRRLWNSRQYVHDYSFKGRNMLRRSSEDITKCYKEKNL